MSGEYKKGDKIADILCFVIATLTFACIFHDGIRKFIDPQEVPLLRSVKESRSPVPSGFKD